MWEWYDIIFSGLFFAISAIKVEITRRWWSFSKVYSISGFSWANSQEKEKLNLGMIEYLKNSQGNFKQISQISWKSEKNHFTKYQGTQSRLTQKNVSTATYRKEICEENEEKNDPHFVPLKSVTFDCKASLDCWDGWMLTMKSWEINSELTN